MDRLQALLAVVVLGACAPGDVFGAVSYMACVGRRSVKCSFAGIQNSAVYRLRARVADVVGLSSFKSLDAQPQEQQSSGLKLVDSIAEFSTFRGDRFDKFQTPRIAYLAFAFVVGTHGRSW